MKLPRTVPDCSQCKQESLSPGPESAILPAEPGMIQLEIGMGGGSEVARKFLYLKRKSRPLKEEEAEVPIVRVSQQVNWG